MTYTIKQIADLAGVTTRTLRYYDQIGLLEPQGTHGNGYRFYDESSLLRLQQILFFREMDVPLNEITHIMSSPEFSTLDALEQHKKALVRRSERINTLITTVDRTIAEIKGETTMTAKEHFDGFDEKKYEEEAKQRWGQDDKYVVSQKRWKSYSDAEKQAIKEAGAQFTLRMVTEDPAVKPDDPAVQAAIGEYLAYLNKYFYPCDAETLRGLSNMWVEDSRFSANYENIREGGAAFVRDAVHVFADNQ